jgi:hypothetical protein
MKKLPFYKIKAGETFYKKGEKYIKTRHDTPKARIICVNLNTGSFIYINDFSEEEYRVPSTRGGVKLVRY